MADDLPLGEVPLEDREEFFAAIMRHFHEDGDDADLSMWNDVLPLDRAIAVRDQGRIVGNFAVIPVDLSVPGGDRVGCAAITTVGVSQTHRRRGLLRRMMTRGLDQALERGEPVAALYASESRIYPRFGFGVSVLHRRYRIDTVQLGFHDPVDPRLVVGVTPEQAEASFPAVFEQMRDLRPGGVGRNVGQWHMRTVLDPPEARDGASKFRRVAVPGRGYAIYRVHEGAGGDLLPSGEVRLGELVAIDREAEQALWQHVCEVDLTTTVSVARRPIDDVLPWLVDDRMRLRDAETNPVYTRILDVPRCLGSRTSGVTEGLVIRVHDPMGYADGTYRWDASPDGSACTASDAPPQIELGIEELSTVWLGGVPVRPLADAGRIVEHDTGTVGRLQRIVASDRAPWTPFMF